jgi:hypothetical protein
MTEPPATPSDASVVAEWPCGRGDRLRISLEYYREQWLFNVRRWYEADDGELRPGKRGFAIALKHLPQIAAATAKALELSRERGLLEPATDDATNPGRDS